LAEFFYDRPPPQAVEIVHQEPAPQPCAAPFEQATEPLLPVCDYCGDFMPEGENGVILSLAKVRRGPKSGMLMLLEEEENVDQAVFNLHDYCLPDFVCENYEVGMGEQLCANCEAKLNGED
jgi:hypothetical protein